MGNSVLAERALRGRECECTSGQSSHAEALELDIDEAIQNHGQQRAARKKKRAGALKILFYPMATMNLRLLQYFVCMRAFFKGCSVLHGSFDASRVGNVNRLIDAPRQLHCEARCTAASFGRNKLFQMNMVVSFQVFAISVFFFGKSLCDTGFLLQHKEFKTWSLSRPQGHRKSLCVCIVYVRQQATREAMSAATLAFQTGTKVEQDDMGNTR